MYNVSHSSIVLLNDEFSANQVREERRRERWRSYDEYRSRIKRDATLPETLPR